MTAPEKPVEHETITLPTPVKPVFVLDEETGTCWVGLPLSAMKFVEASVILDDSKGHVFRWYKRQNVSNKIIRPVMNGVATGFQKTRDFLIRAHK